MNLRLGMLNGKTYFCRLDKQKCQCLVELHQTGTSVKSNIKNSSKNKYISVRLMMVWLSGLTPKNFIINYAILNSATLDFVQVFFF